MLNTFHNETMLATWHANIERLIDVRLENQPVQLGSSPGTHIQTAGARCSLLVWRVSNNWGMFHNPRIPRFGNIFG